MVTEMQKIELLQALTSLPPEKFSAARDFILYLQRQYGQPQAVDETDAWSDEDLHDFAAASRFTEELTT